MGKAQDLRIGLTGGYNLASPTAYDSKSGFHAGVKGELELALTLKGLYLDFGVLLSSQPWKSLGYYYNGSQQFSYNMEGNSSSIASPRYGSEWKSTPYYLNIPIHIGYKFPTGKNVSVFINAGPYLNVGLFGKVEETVTTDKGETTVKTASNNVFKDKMQERFDWGLGFRAGMEIARHVQLSVGYDWGRKNIHNSGVNCKNRTFVASVAYMF